MSPVQRILSLVIAAEVVVGGWVAWQRLSRPEPLLPDFSKVDAETRESLLAQREKARDGDAREWRELGEGFLGTGYYRAAEQAFRRATQMDPNDHQARYGLAFCLERTGQMTAAIPVFEQVARTAEPELSQTCWYQVGRCWLREENMEQAEAAFRQILKFPPAVYQVAKILIRTGRADEAVGMIEQRLSEAPNCLKFLQLRGKAAEALGDAKKVAEMRDREDRGEYIMELEYSLKFLGMLGTKYGLGSRLARALKLKEEGSAEQQQVTLSGAVRLIRAHEFWQYRSAFVALAEVELQLGNITETLKLVREARETSQDGADLLELEGRALYAGGDVQGAVTVLERGLTLKPTLSTCELLTELVEQPDKKQALEMKLALLNVRVHLLVDDASGAEVFARKAVEISPENPDALYSLGEVCRILGRVEEARLNFQKCLAVRPGYGRAVQHLAWIGAE